MWRRRQLLPLTLILFLLLPTATADAADPAAVARARTEFQQALAAQNSGDWAGALVLLQRVAQVIVTPQVRFNVALCEEHLGRLTVAAGDFDIAATEATAANVVNVASEAKTHAADLRARIPRIKLTRGRGAEVATFFLDGNEMGSAMIGNGTEMPLDPGPHRLELRLGAKVKTISFELAERDHKAIEGVLDDDVNAASSSSSTTPSDTTTPPDTKSSSPLPWIIGGVGVASLAASAIFAALQSSAQSELDDICGPDRNACPSSSRSTYDSAKTYSTLTRITLAVGVLGVGSSALLFLTSSSHISSSSPRKTSAAWLTIGGGPGTIGIATAGTFR